MFYFNFRNNRKVFLGDSGSLFLGILVSTYVIHILSQEYVIKEKYDIHKIIFILSVLFYPIFDIIRIIFKRIIEGKSPFEADNNHLHHLILRKTKNHFATTSIIVVSSMIILVILQIIF